MVILPEIHRFILHLFPRKIKTIFPMFSRFVSNTKFTRCFPRGLFSISCCFQTPAAAAAGACIEVMKNYSAVTTHISPLWVTVKPSASLSSAGRTEKLPPEISR